MRATTVNRFACRSLSNTHTITPDRVAVVSIASLLGAFTVSSRARFPVRGVFHANGTVGKFGDWHNPVRQSCREFCEHQVWTDVCWKPFGSVVSGAGQRGANRLF